MSRAFAFLSVSVLAMGAVGAASATCLCAPQIARDVGDLLYRSNPLDETDQVKFDNFRTLVQSNATVLRPNGAIIRCAGDLGSALASAGLANFKKEDYDRAYDNVLRQGGTLDQAQDVADSMQSGSIDAYMMGRELQWLSQVLPAAASGDWRPYFNTTTDARARVRQLLPLLTLPYMGDAAPIVEQMMASLGPDVQEMAVLAACLSWR